MYYCFACIDLCMYVSLNSLLFQFSIIFQLKFNCLQHVVRKAHARISCTELAPTITKRCLAQVLLKGV